MNDSYSRPVGLMRGLYLLAFFGVFITLISLNYQRLENQSYNNFAKQNQEFLRRIENLEELNKITVEEHRERNEVIHADLCRLIYEIIQVAPTLKDKGITPCNMQLTQFPITQEQ